MTGKSKTRHIHFGGKKTPTGQTALKKEVVLGNLNLKFSAHFDKCLRRIYYSDSVPRSQPGLVMVARVLTSTKSRYVEFWRGRVVGEPTEIHTSAFSDQNRNNSNKNKTKTNRLMSIIKIWPNKISNQNFIRFWIY